MLGVGFIVGVFHIRGLPFGPGPLLALVLTTLAPVALIFVGIVIVWIAASIIHFFRRGQAKQASPIMPTFLAILVSLIPCYTLLEMVRAMALDRPPALSFSDYVIAYIPCLVICEATFYVVLKFVAPNELARATSEAQKDDQEAALSEQSSTGQSGQEEDPRNLYFGKSKTLAADILTLSSEGNYVRIGTKQGDRLERIVLNELVERLDPLGVQVSRSQWIAYAAITDAEKSDGNLMLVLENGEKVGVAVRRTKTVLDVLEAKGILGNKP